MMLLCTSSKQTFRSASSAAPITQLMKTNQTLFARGRQLSQEIRAEKSRNICFAANLPGPPVTQPPGWVPEPHW